MSKSQLESNVEFNSEELEVMKIVEKRNFIMAIDFESRTPEQKQALEEYDKKLNNEYKETYARLLRKKKNNENELTVMKALKEKNTILEIKPKSRTKKQTKSLKACNNKLTKMGKQLVENVLSKFSYLNKKPTKKQLLK